jgi:ABC-type nitrate/sulfonate/bicarbonate transport system ATPase subunit
MSSSDLFQNLDNIQKNFDPQPLLNDQQLVAFGIEYSNSVLNKLNMVLEPNRQQYLPIKRFFAGHRGCGKSTLLYQCAQSQQDKYFTVLFSISDIGDIIDVEPK